MKYDYQFLKDYLLYYLQTYLSRRHIVMKDFMTNIKAEIEYDRPISLKQFKVLLKYLMKEKQFENATKRQVIRVFQPFIRSNKAEPASRTFKPALERRKIRSPKTIINENSMVKNDHSKPEKNWAELNPSFNVPHREYD